MALSFFYQDETGCRRLTAEIGETIKIPGARLLVKVEPQGAAFIGRWQDQNGNRPKFMPAGSIVLGGDEYETPVVVGSCEDGWFGFGDFRSGSPAMVETFCRLAMAALSPAPVLLTGESGTGKELAARAVFDLSGVGGAFIAVNCATMHGDTLLAELFGAEKGSYTGCVERRVGAFERAAGGVVFLDEIGEMPLAAQAMMLRVLEVGEVQPLGGKVRKVQVRVVAATHRDLLKQVRGGLFRLDLYHRVAVLKVSLPTLAERAADVVPMLEAGCGKALSLGAKEIAGRHEWPGNFRELKNVAARLRAFTFGATVSAQAFAEHLDANVTPKVANKADRKEQVRQAMAVAGKAQDAWRMSGLNRSAFYRYKREIEQEVK